MPKKSKKQSYSNILKEYDTFESRINLTNQSLYYFNPFTGETAIPDEYGYLNRSLSLWAKIEKPSHFVDFISLLPEFYASRMWGRRKIPKFTQESAAYHITAVAKGFLARLLLRKYYKQKYRKVFDQNSGYYYFQDKYSENNETSWYKPRLAFPNDIEVFEFYDDDPKDFMKGKMNKYTYREFITGPYVRRELGTYGIKRTIRTENHHFLEINPWRFDAIFRLEDIDLNSTPLDTVIHIMDGIKPKETVVSDYLLMRTACLNDNCELILQLISTYRDRPLVQAYGLYVLSKLNMPLDDFGSLSYVSKRAMDLCFDYVLDVKRDIIFPLKVFALQALYNILYTSPGRAEFFDTTTDPPSNSSGSIFDGPCGKKILIRIKTLGRFIENIPLDTVVLREKDEYGRLTKETKSDTPTDYGVSAAEYAITILGFLAWNQDMRESIGEMCMESVMYCMQTCSNETGVLIAGFRALYNFIYRCEVNHQLLNSLPIETIMDKARYYFSGDITVSTQIKRLEMALRHDGWRGNAELDIQLEEEFTARKLTERLERGGNDDVSMLGFTSSVSGKKVSGKDKEINEKLDKGSKHNDMREISVITERSIAESKY